MSRHHAEFEEETIYDVFDPVFNGPMTMIVVAPRNSGKSVFLADLLHQNKHFFDDVFVFAGSDAVFKDFERKIPKSRLKRGYTEENMQQLMNTARNVTDLWDRYPNPSGRPYQLHLVMDDLGFDKSIFKSVVHLEAWMNSRHAQLSLTICLQFVTSVPPTIRSQADWIVALRDPIKSNQMRLQQYFFGIFPTLKDFQKAFNRATENFGALVVNNRCRSTSITKAVFTYRAVQRPQDDKLCHERVWTIDRAVRLRKKIKALEKELQRKQLLARGGMVI